MIARGRTPLGWIQLTHHKGRFAVAIAGVAFAVILVFMQLGFMNMLFDTTVMLHKQLDADIVLTSTKVRDMTSTGTFPRRRLMQALGVEGVADGEALYASLVEWVKPVGAKRGERGQMLMFGVRPDVRAFKDPEIAAGQPSLAVTGTVLFDRGARGDYARLIQAVQLRERPTAEIGGRAATIEGLITVGSAFSMEGVIVASEDTFFTFAPKRSPQTPSLGLIRVAPGQDPEVVARRINAVIGESGDTQALTVPQFIAHSRSYIAKESPISTVFAFGAVIGLIVGTVVVVQILTTDVQDHMPEYATFKAMGFTGRYLLGVVLEQSVILSVCGFVPGLVVALGLYEAIRQILSMPIAMPLDRVATVFGLACGMCLLSGTIAMQRVRRADPAEVF